MAVEERLREKLTRCGSDSPHAGANPDRDDYIRAADRRLAHRLAILNRPDSNPGGVDELPDERR